MKKETVFPGWVIQHKRPGTEIRLISGKYYLYQISSHWDAALKRPKKKTGAYLGRITPQGFKPKKAEQSAADDSQISVRQFGAVHYFEQRSGSILQELEKSFPQWSQTLFAGAVMRLLYQSPLKKMQFYYQNSYASLLWQDARMSDKSMSECLRQTGQMRSAIVDFFARFHQGSRFVLIDGTNVHSRSRLDGLATPGYNSQKDFRPQVNALFIFAQDEKAPLYYRLTGGDIREVSSMKTAVEESRLKDVIIVSDKGFYSEENVEALLREKLHFAIPLKRNSLLIDYSAFRQGDKQAYDGHFFYDKRPIWFNKRRLRMGGRYCYVYSFLDERLYQEEQRDYLERVTQKRKGYDMSLFHQNHHKFGTLSLLTYLPRSTSAQQAYEYFKTRNEVEQMIDVFKNILHADKSYMRTAQQMEGWMFLNHLALMLYYQLFKELARLDLLSRYSPMEVLQYLERIYKVKAKGQWRTAEIPKRARLVAEKLGLPIP
jgi:transposase